MNRIISFAHISLDGFVAGPNREMDWITINEEIFDHVGNRINETDTALYGRVTYELMESYWPYAGNEPGASKHDIEHAGWYKQARKVVLSKTMKETGSSNTKIIGSNLTNSIQELKQEGGGSKEILVFGSPTATHSLMEQNLIDGYWLFLNPVILGNGIPLFVKGKEKIKLDFISSLPFASGVVELNYSVKR